jgi:hypothetical protein
MQGGEAKGVKYRGERQRLEGKGLVIGKKGTEFWEKRQCRE